MLIIIAPHGQLPQEKCSLAPGRIPWERQGVVVERNSTGTEQCTVGYPGRNFSLRGNACRTAGVYEYLLPLRVLSIVRETLPRPWNDPFGMTDSDVLVQRRSDKVR